MSEAFDPVDTSDDARVMESKILRGQASKKDLLKMKMRVQGKTPGYYENLARDMDYKDIDELVQVAIKEKNLNALRGLAELNRLPVAAHVQESLGFELIQDAAAKGSEIAPELFFLLRSVLQPQYKRLFKNLTKMIILKESRKIAGRGLKGFHRMRVRYIPYRTDLDVPATITRLAGRPLSYMRAADLVGIERAQRKKACVLILDTSGSMYGRLIFNAALTTAVLSYHMRDNEHAVVIFNTGSETIKKMTERKDVNKLIDQILESQASGFTNIAAGLHDGLDALKQSSSTFKFGILITDGNANRNAAEMFDIAARFENLNVIAIPPEMDQVKGGIKNCEELARRGKGLFVRVGQFRDIPRALQRLLLKL